MRTMTLRPGILLYHGTSARARFEPDAPRGPAWFSRAAAVARRFSVWHRGQRPRVMTYRVVRPIEGLVVIRGKDDLEAVFGDFAGSGVELAEELERARVYAGWVMPTNYHDGDDILIVDPGPSVEYVVTDRVSGDEAVRLWSVGVQG